MGLFNFFRKNGAIKPEKFKSEAFQKEILEKAHKWYLQNERQYDKTADKLKAEGLSSTQIEEILQKLKQRIKEMVQQVKEEMDSGNLRVEMKPTDKIPDSAEDTKKTVDMHIGFGAFQMDKGEYDNALELFDKAIELDDRATLAYANKGTLYSRKEEYDQALFFYNKALEIQPTNKEILSNKASVLESLGRSNELIATYKLILEQHPNDINALNDLGIRYAQMNDLNTAITYFEKLLIIQPEDQDALHNNLMALCKVDLEKAKYFHLSKLQLIQDDKLHHLVPASFDSIGQRTQAEQHYDDMYRLAEDEKYIMLKGHFLCTRDPQKAITLYDQYLKSNPDNEEVKKYRSTLVGTPESSALFQLLHPYREYIITFVTMMTKGSYAPIGSYEMEDGSIRGFLYVPGDAKVDLTPREAVNRMRIEFDKRLREHSLRSYIIYYHTHHDKNANHIVANDSEGLNAISLEYKSRSGVHGNSAIPYSFDGEKFNIENITGLNESQNQQIWNTQLTPGKNYFQDVVAVKYEGYENENNLQIRKKYEGKVGDFWKGVFGLSNHTEMKDSQIWAELLATAFAMGTKIKKDKYIVAEFQDNKTKIRVISKDTERNILTFFPVLVTKNSFSINNKFVNEWAHVENLEARITGQLQNGTEVGYYATDYALNREIYTSRDQLNIKISGIVYAMKIYEPEPNHAILNETYCGISAYENGGEDSFQFVGILQDFKETEFISIPTFKGYIISIKLNNSSNKEEMFAVDMFVNKQNIQFNNLEIGMKISGLVIFQGEINEGK